MSQTATSLADVLMEAWGPDRLVKQFEDKAGPLGRIEQVKATMIGKQAQTPIHKYLAAGYTSVGAGGGAVNTAGNQQVDQAVWTLVNHYHPISLEFSALNQASGNNLQSVVGSKDLEIKGSLSTLRKQMVRQLVTNGDSILASCDTGGASTTVEMLTDSATSYGYQALRRGWLYPGLVVDIGATSDTDSIVTASAITAIKKSSTDPDITIGSSVSTVSGTDFVYIANPNSATAANPEMNGLRNIVHTTGALGGLNPATAGEEFWAAASRDTTTTVFSLDLALNLQREVLQESGENFTDVWTGYKQQQNFYSLLQNQVRFAGETKMGAGDTGGVLWNGMKVDAFPDILDTDWWCLTLSDFQKIVGDYDKPVWVTDVEGSGGKLRWRQGFTSFESMICYGLQIGVSRRNTHAGASALTA